jgi:hypothetical protein
MSGFTTTPNLGLFKPNYAQDRGQWANHWNANADKLDQAIGPNAPFLPISGGKMTGPLTLAANPVASLDAATKQYVDSHVPTGGGIPEAPTDGNTYGRGSAAWKTVLPTTGGTLSGPLTLAADPVSALAAATKQYVDTNIMAIIGGVTKTDRSGVITLGGTAQVLMPANPSRNGWSFQNKSVGNMWFNDLSGGADPASNSSTYLPPGAYYESETGGASVAAISLIGDTTGAQFVAKEW